MKYQIKVKDKDIERKQRIFIFGPKKNLELTL